MVCIKFFLSSEAFCSYSFLLFISSLAQSLSSWVGTCDADWWKAKLHFHLFIWGKEGWNAKLTPTKKSCQGVQGWQTILLLIRLINTTDLRKNQLILLRFHRIFKATFGEKQSLKNGWFHGNFQSKVCTKSIIDFALISQVCSMFFNKDNYLLFQQQSAWEMSQWAGFNIITTAQFSQHNLCLIVLGCCLLIVVMKFEDNFASLRQLNSPNSRDKFQICCINMHLTRFLANLVGFRSFTRILRRCGLAKYQKPCIITTSP